MTYFLLTLTLLDTYILDAHIKESLFRILVAIFCGFILGYEREFRGKSAGLRTNILICMGSCLYMIISEYVAREGLKNGFVSSDPGRIAAQVVTGIGFLGAGSIIRHRGGISGLTTAASIWGIAAIGLAAGSGMYVLALFSSIGYIIIIEAFYYLARIIRFRTYRFMKMRVVLKNEVKVDNVRKKLRDMKVQFSQENINQIAGEVHYLSLVYLKGKMEEKIIREISKQKGVKEVNMLNTGTEL